MGAVYSIFLKHARALAARIPPAHAVAYATAQEALHKIEAFCLARIPPSSGLPAVVFSWPAVAAASVILGLTSRHLYGRHRSGAWHGSVLPRVTDSWDVFVLFLAVASALFVVAFAGVPLAASLNASSPAHGGSGSGGALVNANAPVPPSASSSPTHAGIAGGASTAAAGVKGTGKALAMTPSSSGTDLAGLRRRAGAGAVTAE